MQTKIGEMVYYYDHQEGPPLGSGASGRRQEPMLAFISHVCPCGTCEHDGYQHVNLAIFDRYGRPVDEPPIEIPLLDSHEEIPAVGGFACLPDRKVVWPEKTETDPEFDVKPQMQPVDSNGGVANRATEPAPAKA
jgi:hypothetical protein